MTSLPTLDTLTDSQLAVKTLIILEVQMATPNDLAEWENLDLEQTERVCRMLERGGFLDSERESNFYPTGSNLRWMYSIHVS